MFWVFGREPYLTLHTCPDILTQESNTFLSSGSNENLKLFTNNRPYGTRDNVRLVFKTRQDSFLLEIPGLVLKYRHRNPNKEIKCPIWKTQITASLFIGVKELIRYDQRHNKEGVKISIKNRHHLVDYKYFCMENHLYNEGKSSKHSE